MARNSNSKRNKNFIQNVRVIDKEEGTDDVVISRLISSYNSSEGQIRVMCSYRTEVSPGSGGATSGSVDFGSLVSTDDFTSFAAQYQEFRVRGIRFDVYDVNPNSPATINYFATFHQVGGTVPAGQEDIIDRPDSRIVTPGMGRISLAWVAHGIPEMAFQSVSSYDNLGGLVDFVSPSATITGAKYSIVAKFLVDFRGRR